MKKYDMDVKRYNRSGIGSRIFASKQLKYLKCLRKIESSQSVIFSIIYRFKLKLLSSQTSIQIPFGTKIGGGLLSWSRT